MKRVFFFVFIIFLSFSAVHSGPSEVRLADMSETPIIAGSVAGFLLPVER